MKPKYIYDIGNRALEVPETTPNRFSAMAEKREQEAARLSDEEIWINVARNILQNPDLDDDLKADILLTTIPDIDAINNSIRLEFQENYSNFLKNLR